MPREHPFDFIGFDGDGHGTPDVDDDTADDLRAQWQALNAIRVPSIR